MDHKDDKDDNMQLIKQNVNEITSFYDTQLNASASANALSENYFFPIQILFIAFNGDAKMSNDLN